MFAPRFAFIARRPAVVHGWQRRLGQPSVRNWGRPSHPAPTSCLVPGEAVSGVAFGIAEHRWSDVYEALMAREAQEPVECAVALDDSTVPAITWPMSDGWSDHSIDRLVEAGRVNVLAGGGPHGHALDYAGGVMRELARHGLQDGFIARYHHALHTAVSVVSPTQGGDR